jgi:MMPL family
VALGVGVDYALFIVSRHRTGLLARQSPEDAAVTALNTSGHAVLLAGLTACAALLGLFALGVSFLYGEAVAVTLMVGLTMLASLTLLPAMLGFLGPNVLRRAERGSFAQQGSQARQAGGFWLRWAEGLGRRPLVPAVLALAVIGVLAIPFFSMRAGLLDASTDPTSTTTYQACQLLAKGFGPGFNGPLVLVGQVNSPADQARFASFADSARRQPGVAGVTPPQLSPDGKAEVAEVYPATGPQEAATTTLLDRLRADVSRAEAGSTLAIRIGGTTAANEDFSRVLNAKMPQFVAVVAGLAFLLLAVVFRSLLIPLVASLRQSFAFSRSRPVSIRHARINPHNRIRDEGDALMDVNTFLSHRRALATASGQIACTELGAGPAALFVHGLGTSGALWRHVIEGLSGTSRCIAADLPAHGASPARPAMTCPPPRWPGRSPTCAIASGPARSTWPTTTPAARSRRSSPPATPARCGQ